MPMRASLEISAWSDWAGGRRRICSGRHSAARTRHSTPSATPDPAEAPRTPSRPHTYADMQGCQRSATAPSHCFGCTLTHARKRAGSLLPTHHLRGHIAVVGCQVLCPLDAAALLDEGHGLRGQQGGGVVWCGHTRVGRTSLAMHRPICQCSMSPAGTGHAAACTHARMHACPHARPHTRRALGLSRAASKDACKPHARAQRGLAMTCQPHHGGSHCWSEARASAQAWQVLTACTSPASLKRRRMRGFRAGCSWTANSTCGPGQAQPQGAQSHAQSVEPANCVGKRRAPLAAAWGAHAQTPCWNPSPGSHAVPLRQFKAPHPARPQAA